MSSYQLCIQSWLPMVRMSSPWQSPPGSPNNCGLCTVISTSSLCKLRWSIERLVSFPNCKDGPLTLTALGELKCLGLPVTKLHENHCGDNYANGLGNQDTWSKLGLLADPIILTCQTPERITGIHVVNIAILTRHFFGHVEAWLQTVIWTVVAGNVVRMTGVCHIFQGG